MMTLPHQAPNTENCNRIQRCYFDTQVLIMPLCMLHHKRTVYLLTILWTSVFPSDFEWSGLCGGEEVSQSEPDSLLSGETSSPNRGSSSRSLQKENRLIKRCICVRRLPDSDLYCCWFFARVNHLLTSCPTL